MMRTGRRSPSRREGGGGGSGGVSSASTNQSLELLAELRRRDCIQKEVEGVIEIRQNVRSPKSRLPLRSQPIVACVLPQSVVEVDAVVEAVVLDNVK